MVGARLTVVNPIVTRDFKRARALTKLLFRTAANWSNSFTSRGGTMHAGPITRSRRAVDVFNLRKSIETGIRVPGDVVLVEPIRPNYFDLSQILDDWGPKRLDHGTEATSKLYAARECARLPVEQAFRSAGGFVANDVVGNVRQMIDLTETELREGLLSSLAVPRWVDEVMAGFPFDSVESLLAKAAAAATPLSPGEIDEAIAHHPRIGETAGGRGAAQAFSRAEQASLGDKDVQIVRAMRAGNAAYENRFDRVFIIRAAGRTRAEILAELQRRIELPNATELEIVGEQLRDIALLRIEKLYGERLGGEQ